MTKRIHRRPARSARARRFRRRPTDPAVRSELALIAEVRRLA